MSIESDFKNHTDKCKRMIKKYGTTRKIGCAGFIMPDGKMINFCRKKKTDSHDRTYEHYEMVKECYQKKGQIVDADILPFQKECGVVRIRHGPIRTWVSAVRKPTVKQVEQLKKAIVDGCDRLYAVKIDNSKEADDERICESIINQPRPLDIQRWINKCW